MIPSRLDKSQLLAKKKFEENGKLFIYGDKDSGKSYLIRNIIAEFLYKDKKVLYLTKNHAASQAVKRLMEEFRLGDQCFILLDNYTQDPVEQEKLKSWVHKRIEKDRVDSSSALNDLAFEKLKLRCEKFYKHLNQAQLFGKSWQEMIVIQAFDKQSLPVLHLNQFISPAKFEFSQPEYDLLLDRVVEAFEFVKEGRAFTDPLFKVENYSKENENLAWKAIDNWLGLAMKRIIATLVNVSKYLQNKSSVAEQEYLSAFHIALKKLDDLDFEVKSIIAYEANRSDSKTKFAIFQSGKSSEKQILSKKKELRESFENLMRDLKEEHILSLPTIEIESEPELRDLEVSLEEVKTYISNFHSSLYRYKKNKLEAINFNQGHDANLDALDAEIEELFQWLGSNDYISDKFEATAFSLIKKMMQLEKVLEKMQGLKAQKNTFIKFYKWNVLYFGLSTKEAYLIDKMMKIQPRNWVSFFRNWYVQNMIKIQEGLFFGNVDEELSMLNEFFKIDKNYGRDSFDYNKIERFSMLKDAKEDFKSFKKIIASKNKEEISNFKLIEDHFDFLTTIYPLTLAVYNEDTFSQYSDKKWDLIVVQNDNILDDISTILKNTNQENKGQLILAKQTASLDDKTMSQIDEGILPAIELKGYHQQNMIKLIEMNHTERLYAARNLAYLLEDVNPQIVTFRLDHYIIFSCLSEPLNQVLKQLLDERGIKQMRVLESPFHLLVENLLEVKGRQILLTQDMLINNREYDRLEWQLAVKERVSRAGIRIIDMKTHDLLQNTLQVLLTFVEKHFSVSLHSDGSTQDERPQIKE